MCDFLLHYHWLLNGTVVLDLGAGSGLTSIVAAMAAKTVFCTGLYIAFCVIDLFHICLLIISV